MPVTSSRVLMGTWCLVQPRFAPAASHQPMAPRKMARARRRRVDFTREGLFRNSEISSTDVLKKLQIPSSKLQRNSKHQISITEMETGRMPVLQHFAGLHGGEAGGADEGRFVVHDDADGHGGEQVFQAAVAN